ncbi:hypothetical protein [Cellulomonas sp. P5_E12]
MRPVLISGLVHSFLLVGALVAVSLILRQWIADRFLLLAAALAVVGATYYGVGIGWWLDPDVGLWASRALAVGSVAVIVVVAFRARDRLIVVVRTHWLPLAAMCAYAFAVLGLGFLRGGAGTPADTPASRFTWRLPPDNVLPYLFGRHVELHGHSSVPPPVSGWLSSDRPPLQSAIWLGQTLGPRDDVRAALDYQVVGVLLQSVWVLGVWVLLGVLAARRASAAVALGACAATGVIVVNTFYVWPKLLAAAFALTSLAVVLRRPGARAPAQYGLAALLAALAYLSHGGVAFLLAPVALLGFWRAWHASRRWASLGTAIGCAVVVVAPWTAYQRLVDPPGDRLLAWMLADVKEIDARRPLAAIRDQYAAVGLAGAVENKVQNVMRLLGHGGDTSKAIQNLDSWDGSAIAFWRSETFYSLLPALGLLLVLAVGWIVRRDRHPGDLRAATTLAGVTGAGLLFWVLAMFGPGTTFLHQGTFAFVLLAACALALAGSALSIQFATFVVVATAAVTLVVALPQRVATGAPVLPDAPVLHSAAVVSLGSAAVFVALLVLSARSRTMDPEIVPPLGREPVHEST